MTQNLDFDLDSSKPLTSADSDISESRGSWTPTDTQNDTMGFSDYYGTQSFDPGMYVNNDPTAWTYCNNYWNGGSCDNWTNVSNMSPMAEIRDESTNIVDTNSNTYDAITLPVTTTNGMPRQLVQVVAMSLPNVKMLRTPSAPKAGSFLPMVSLRAPLAD